MPVPVPSLARSPHRRGWVAAYAGAAVFFLACTWGSYARWANYDYRTFDLAYYVQALWQLIHGRSEVTVIHAPLLGNHVEPIVLLLVPVFAIFRHPMVFVVAQNLALAAMAPIGYAICRRLGIHVAASAAMALALLVAPASGYIALHEFHPEALAAPLLLLLIHARLAGRRGAYWLWFALVLACKENMAPLLVAFCVVQLVAERKRPFAELRSYYLWPLAVAVAWFLLCTQVITPAFNRDNIDYVALYDRLGASGREILANAVLQPQRILNALATSVTGGNLLPALLLPFLCLPLLRPRWLLIAAPVLLQHLLSWRSSEWTIYFHYAAPLLPLFWVGSVEAIAGMGPLRHFQAARLHVLPWAVLAGSVVGQAVLGPAASITETTGTFIAEAGQRSRTDALLRSIPANASLVAPLPYLSHHAARPELYSLHYILKGLKTLSRSAYEPPPPTDAVLIDHGDDATFDAVSGYYHPAMKTVDGGIIPSSEQLLHRFLARAEWSCDAQDELTILRPGAPRGSSLLANESAAAVTIAQDVQLLSSAVVPEVIGRDQILKITTAWAFGPERTVFPWMWLVLADGNRESVKLVSRGLVGIESGAGRYQDEWSVTTIGDLPAGEYYAELVFVEGSKRAWREAVERRPADLPPLARISLGAITVR